MPGKGTPQEVQERAASLDLTLDIPERIIVEPLAGPEPLIEGEGLQPELQEGFFKRTERALKVASPTYNAVTGMLHTVPENEPDPEFNILERKDLFSGVHEDNFEYLAGAVSAEDALQRKQKIADEEDNINKLMQGGAVSAFAYMAASGTVLDLLFWGGVKGELMLERFIVGKGTRLTRGIARGLVAAGTAGTETSVLAANQATTDSEDVLYATAAAMALGTSASIGAEKLLAGTVGMSKAADALQDKLAKDITETLDQQLYDSTKGSKFVQSTDDATESMLGDYKPSKEAQDTVEGFTDESTISPWQAFKDNFENTKFDPKVITGTKTFKVLANNPLMSDFVKILKSKSKKVQFFGSQLLENASGAGGRSKTAAVMKHMWERNYLEKMIPEFSNGYKEYARVNKIAWNSEGFFGTGLRKYNLILRNELERYRNASIKGVPYESTAPDYIKRSVDAWRQNIKEVAELARKEGVRGFDEFRIHDGYVPLSWNGQIMAGLSKPLTKRYTKLLTAGYRAADIDEKSAQMIAEAVFNRKAKQALGLDTNPGALLAHDSREFLTDMLKINKVKDSDIDALFTRIDLQQANRGTSARAKSRVPVDLTITDGDISLMDLVNNDMASLGSRYIGEITGRASLARKGITDDGVWTSIVNGLIKDAKDSGDTNIPELRKILDGTYQQFLSQPVGKGVHKGVRRLQELAMTTMLGQVGVPQIAESGNILGSHGVASIFRHSPDLRSFRKAVRNGEDVSESLLGEINVHYGGMWHEELFFRPDVRLDDRVGDSNKIFKAYDTVLAKAKHSLGYVSGMNYVKNLQQQFTAISQANKVINAIKSGKTDRLLKRFETLGWDSGTLTRIKKYIDNGTVTFQKNGSIDRLNLESWDAKTFEDFGIGLHRHSSQIIQFPLIGETAYWQHETVGSMMTQFRSFTILAIEKQSARQMHMNDASTYTAFTASLGLAGLLYIGKSYANSVGRKDKKEYLKKRMSNAAVFNGALAWSGVFSASSEVFNASAAVGLVPADWGTGTVGKASPGRGIDKFFVPPAISTAINGLKFSAGMLNSITPFGEVSVKNEINHAAAIIPLMNTWPGAVTKNLMHKALDEDK